MTSASPLSDVIMITGTPSPLPTGRRFKNSSPFISGMLMSKDQIQGVVPQDGQRFVPIAGFKDLSDFDVGHPEGAFHHLPHGRRVVDNQKANAAHGADTFPVGNREVFIPIRVSSIIGLKA